MKYSILDIAKKAGVSKSTVSRVFNGGCVSEKARAAISAVLDETGYYPSLAARTLRGAKSNVIGIISSSAESFLNQSFNTRLAGIISTLYAAGYSAMLINNTKKNGDLEAFRFLDQKNVDGLIFMQNPENEQMRQAISKYRTVVYTGERILPNSGLRIYMGNYDYSLTLYRYLMKHNHRRILTIAGHQMGKVLNSRRYDAYLFACGEYNITPSVEDFWFFATNTDTADFFETIYHQFKHGKYTGIFVDNINYANRIAACFAQHGLAITKDFSIVAVERGASDLTKDPNITAVLLPDCEYGVKAAEMILEALGNPKLTYKDVELKFTLEERNSVGIAHEA